jgi:perosamine synthetase
MIPYGRQSISQEDIGAVIEVLKSDWLTTGPKVEEFERAFAASAGSEDAVAVASGTAALHCAVYAAGIREGDEVIVSSMTFAASANCVLYQGGTPVFADVDAGTLLMNPQKVEEKVSGRTKAIVAVDYAGQPCEYDDLRDIAERHGLVLISDACHSLGGSYRGRGVGSLAELNTFSFHPVKHITTGEGGMVTTDNGEYAARMRMFRNHGIDRDSTERRRRGTWYYEMVDLGWNYRLTDIQCALGVRQLERLPGWVRRRREIAGLYDAGLAGSAFVPLEVREEVSHAYHLYVVRVDADRAGATRDDIFRGLRGNGIGAMVHYIPVHLHPFYRTRLKTGEGMCPVAEAAYEDILSLPLFPAMTDGDVHRVMEAVRAYG